MLIFVPASSCPDLGFVCLLCVCVFFFFDIFPCNESIRPTGIVRDDWQVGPCAKKLISDSPDISLLKAGGQVQKIGCTGFASL